MKYKAASELGLKTFPTTLKVILAVVMCFLPLKGVKRENSRQEEPYIQASSVENQRIRGSNPDARVKNSVFALKGQDLSPNTPD